MRQGKLLLFELQLLLELPLQLLQVQSVDMKVPMKELNYIKTNLIANLRTFICNTVKLICNTEYCKVCCNSAGPCVVCQVSARFFTF